MLKRQQSICDEDEISLDEDITMVSEALASLQEDKGDSLPFASKPLQDTDDSRSTEEEVDTKQLPKKSKKSKLKDPPVYSLAANTD